MKSVLSICILILAIAFQNVISQQESGWIDKGDYLENKLVTSYYSIVQFSTDGNTILTYGNDKIIRKWNTETGSLLKEINMSDYQYSMYDISSDNKYFACNYLTSDNIDSSFIYDIDNNSIICQIETYSNYEPWGSVEMKNKFIKFNPMTNCVLLASETNYHYISAYQSGMIGDYFECCFDSCKYGFLKADLVPYKFEYSPDGKKYAICGYTEYTASRSYLNYYKHGFYYDFEIINTELNETVFILDSYSTENEYYNPHKPDNFLFTPDSKYLAVFDENKLKFWDAATGILEMVIDYFPYYSYYNNKTMFSNDMKYLIQWANNNNNLLIHFIHLKDTESSETLNINGINPACLDLSNDSSFVIGTTDGRLILIKDIYQNIIKPSNKTKINLIYPNPTNDKAQVNFSLAENSSVKIILFDFMGNEIKTIIDDNRNEGDYVKSFDTWFLTEGMYFLKLQTGTETSLFKLMINR